MIELKLYSTIAVQPVVEMLIPPFEKAHSCRFDVVWNTAPVMVKRLQSGERGDVLLLNRAGTETMTAAGRLIEGSQTPIASSATAIAVRAGARRPDVSSVEALKRTLRDARSLSYSHPDAGGASGIYFAKLLRQWGMAAEINAKTRFPPPAGLTAAFLITGEADIAIQQKPELLQVPGIEIVGFLPGELHMVTYFVAGIEKQSPHADLAKAFIDSLRTPEARAAFEAKALDPA
jgi:molybdate transport system substrate-binding protein